MMDDWKTDEELSTLPFSSRYHLMRGAEAEAETHANHAASLRFSISQHEKRIESEKLALEDHEYQGSQSLKFATRLKKLLDQDLPKPE